MKQQENNEFKYHPIVNVEVVSNDSLNLDINFWIEKIYQFRNIYPESVHISNRNGWQSKSDIHFHKEFFPLVEILNKKIQLYTNSPNCTIKDMWLNISPPGSYNAIHCHTPYEDDLSQSGVLYFKCPPNGGNIIFHNPISIYNETFISPKENLLLFFSSRLPHSVEPNLSQEDRISIAFNYE